MLEAIRRRLRVAQFNHAVRDIAVCPPVHCDTAQALTLVSQLRHTDILMYLLALKTFARYLTPGRVVVLNDGSLDNVDQALLQQQIPGVEIRPISAINTGPCPRGGTWERLLHILDLSRDAYVIQLDADTMTLTDIADIRQCIAENRSFTLGTPTGREIVSFDEASEFIQRHLPDAQHVQVFAERALARAPNKEGQRYVRGNSGFAGFGRGACSRAQVEAFSQTMSTLLGADKWQEWGSEQVSSNFAVANSPNGLVLPQPRYAFFNPKLDYTQSAFLHFIGTHRFHDGTYAQLGRTAIAELQKTAP